MWQPEAIWPSRPDGELRPVAPDLAWRPCWQLVIVTVSAQSRRRIRDSELVHWFLRFKDARPRSHVNQELLQREAKVQAVSPCFMDEERACL